MSGSRSTPGRAPIGAPPPTPGVAAVLAVAVAVLVVAAVASCSGPAPGADRTVTGDHQPADSGLRPADRTVAVVTTACGSASATIGSAVLLDDRTVLTTAHLIAGADEVAVVANANLPPDRTWPRFSPVTLFEGAAAASVIAFDSDRDLALLTTAPGRAGPPGLQRPELDTAAVDVPVEINGVSTPPVAGVIAQRTMIEVDAVRSGNRVRRDGYRVNAPTGRGDSGAGVWSAEGHLVGLVFAVSSADDTRTWAVSGREIESFLDTIEGGPPQTYRCDVTGSRLVAQP